MSDDWDLALLQRWMVDLLCDPDDPDKAFRVDEVIAASATLTAGQRVDLYRAGYRLRLLECLRAMHPGLRHALGDQLFDDFALDYLHEHPSRSYTLLRLGATFSQYLYDTRPEGEPWTDFVIDVVRFEQAFLEVYDGPGPESGHRTGRLIPGLKLFTSPYPVGDYVLAVRRGEHPELPAPEASWLALGRRNYVVTMVALTATSFAVLAGLLGGATVADAARANDAETSDVRVWIQSWADQGLIWET